MSRNQKRVQNHKPEILTAEKKAIQDALTQMKPDAEVHSKRRVKNSSDSIQYRKEGIRIFEQHQTNLYSIRLAFRLLSQSISLAPNKSEELVNAYWARSTILLHLRKYKECITDLDRCLAVTNCQQMKPKFMTRKLECISMLKKTDTDGKNKTVILKRKSVVILDEAQDKQLPSFTPNAAIPCLSDAVSLRFNNKDGRHLIATRKINPGEVVAVEKAYVSILCQSGMYMHCSHCLKSCWCSVPCESCIYSMYCSVECKNDAWKRYHDIECSVITSIWDIEDKEMHKQPLCVRLLIQAVKDAGGFDKLRKDLEDVEENRGFENDRIDYNDPYRLLYTHMTTVFDPESEDWTAVTKTATNLLYFLATRSNFFGQKFVFNPSNFVNNRNIVFAGALLHRHLYSALKIANCYQRRITSNELNCKTFHVGGSLMPVCYFFNHSCTPNVASFVANGDKRVVVALYPIQKDEQLFDNYGCLHGFMDINDRQTHLSTRYSFECHCIACKENWPLFSNIPHLEELLLSKNSSDVQEVLKEMDQCSECFDKNFENDSSTLENLSKLILMLRNIVEPPCFELLYLVTRLQKCFIASYGDLIQMPDF